MVDREWTVDMQSCISGQWTVRVFIASPIGFPTGTRLPLATEAQSECGLVEWHNQVELVPHTVPSLVEKTWKAAQELLWVSHFHLY